MTKITPLITLLTVILVLTMVACLKFDSNTPIKKALSKGEGLSVGVAIANITPTEYKGIVLEGYEPRTCNEVHDQISARCISIIDGEEVVVLIALDLIGMLKIHNNELIHQISKNTGIDDDHIFIHCIHSHSGPAMLDISNDSRKYRNIVNDLVTEAVFESLENTQKARAVFQTGMCDAPIINRRHPTVDVTQKFTSIGFLDEDDLVLATVINFACHPVVLGPDNYEITADYVYYLRNHVEEALGGTAIYLNGSYGDINPIAIHEKWIYGRDGGTFTMAEELGVAIADEVLNAFEFSEEAEITIEVQTEKCRLKDGKITQKTTHFSILDLGSIQMAMVPGEPLSGFGQKIEGLLPGPYTMLLGTVNDYQSYIVDAEEWGKCSYRMPQIGCFEESKVFDSDIADLLEQGFSELVDKMYSN
ncbi:MAG: hypothetical protein PF541_11185 [Prolixibacteraceae bacterium]|jgi:hypothetical protein|nr:hypothetical protein [Prolixibacteraceae bacterium]